MNEALSSIFSNTETGSLDVLNLAIRFAASTLLGWIIAEVYRFTKFRSQNRYDRSMYVTLVLLTVLICMVTTVVGNSIARAFSLAGALAIVRFRTVVEDTRDTAFVIFGVVTGMAIGCSQWLVPLVGVPIVSLAALGMQQFTSHSFSSPVAPKQERYRIRLRLGLGVNIRGPVEQAIDDAFRELKLIEIQTTKQGAAIDVVYDALWSGQLDPLEWVNRLNRMEGVQAIALEKSTEPSSNF
ncbi:DUF4956 domain-containing protein [Pirellulaceae bacterium SH501]